MPDAKQLDCKEAMSQLWDFLDEELTPETIAAVKAHLDVCADCLPHAEFADRFLHALRRCRPVDEMPRELKDRVRSCLEKEGFETA